MDVTKVDSDTLGVYWGCIMSVLRVYQTAMDDMESNICHAITRVAFTQTDYGTQAPVS